MHRKQISGVGYRVLGPKTRYVRGLRREETIHVSGRLERNQVGELLTDTGQLDGQLELVRDGQYDTSARGAIQLGEYDARQRHGIAELLGLADGVLAGRGVQNEQDLIRGAAQLALADAANLLQLLHQVAAGMKATGGIGDDVVGLTRARGLDSVVDDGGRIPAFAVLDDLSPGPLRPDVDLIDRRGAKGISRGKDHAIAVLLQTIGQLAKGSGLPYPVDSDHKVEGRLVGRYLEPIAFRPSSLFEHRHQIGLDACDHFPGICHPFFLNRRFQVVEDHHRRVDVDVGLNEKALQLLKKLFVDASSTGNQLVHLLDEAFE